MEGSELSLFSFSIVFSSFRYLELLSFLSSESNLGLLNNLSAFDDLVFSNSLSRLEDGDSIASITPLKALAFPLNFCL